MTIRAILFTSLLCSPALIFAQTYYKEYREERFLKELQKTYKKPLPNAFFVIQASTALEVFTNAPAIIDRMAEIKKYQPCPYIFGIWKNDGGLGRNFYRYLKDNYYIDTSYFSQHYLSDTLYNLLGSAANNNIHYFYRGKRVFFCEGKYERVPQTPLPYDIVHLGKEEITPFQESDDYYHTNLSWYFPINDTLGIELFDAGSAADRVRLCNLQTGEVYKRFDPSQINYIDIFNKYFSHLGWDSTAISEGDKELTYTKRTPLRVDHISVISPEEIYLQCTPGITQKLKDTAYIPGEYGTETITLKPGDLLGSSYGLWLKTDVSLSVKDTFVIDDLTKNEYTLNNFPLYTDKFTSSGDSVYYFYSYYYNRREDKTYEDIKRRNRRLQFIDAFKKEDDMLIFSHKEKPHFIRSFEECYYYVSSCNMLFFKTPKRYFTVFKLYPEIYAFDEENPVMLIADTSKLKYSLLKGNYDTITEEHLPFYSFATGYVHEKRFLILGYKLENQFFLNVYDANMSKVQQLDVTKEIKNILPPDDPILLYDNGVHITPNNLFAISCDDKGCKRTNYKIKLRPVNNGYLEHTGSFE